MARTSLCTSALSALLGAGLALGACSSGESTTRLATTVDPPSSTNPRDTSTTGIPTTGACPGRLSAPIATDRTTYSKGSVLNVVVKLTNISKQPCTIPREFPEPFAQHFEIVNAKGAVVWHAEICVMGRAAPPRPRTLKAGESMGWVTAEVPLRKDLKGCDRRKRAELPAGRYTVRTTSATPTGQIAQAKFTIT